MATKSTTSKNTNLFYQLYSTPNDLTDSGFTCSSAIDEADTSFDITGSAGEITDSNGDTLSAIDLSGIHADELTEYSTETKIIQPYSAYLLQGNVTGDTYMAQYFRIPDALSGYPDTYPSYLNIAFDFHYITCGDVAGIRIDTYNLRTEPGSVVDLIQAKFDELDIPVTVSINTLPDCACGQIDSSTYNASCPTTEADFLVLQSTQEGYCFFAGCATAKACDTEYQPYTGEWVDFTESPYVCGNIDFDYIIDLIRTVRPRYVGVCDYPDYSVINCAIYYYLVNIAPLAMNEFAVFAYNIKALREFAKCFDETGVLTNQSYFMMLGTMYNDMYAYYWAGVSDNGILQTYNIHDVLKLLEAIASYIHSTNISVAPYALTEDESRRVYSQKYPNGAFRGVVIVPDWPDDAENYNALLAAHVRDYIDIDVPVVVPDGVVLSGVNCGSIYTRKRVSVKINTLLKDEYDEMRKSVCPCVLRRVTSNEQLSSSFDGVWTKVLHAPIDLGTAKWSNSTTYMDGSSAWSDYVKPDNSGNVGSHREHMMRAGRKPDASKYFVNEWNVPEEFLYMSNVPGLGAPQAQEEAATTVGMYRFVQHMNETGGWFNIGEGYINIGLKDEYTSSIRNLQPSILLLNTSNIPLRIKFMIMS